jgi:hypothetical protein
MVNFMATILLLLTSALVLAGIWRAMVVWRRHRETRLVACPHAGETAAVRIDAQHAALTALVESQPIVRFADCSRWAAFGRCQDDCLPQVQAAGLEGTVGAVAGRWYAGRSCAYCGKPISEVAFLDHHAALADDHGTTVEWNEIAPEALPALFDARRPVCWDCHVAESFRRLHPELVVDRPSAGRTART